MKTTKFLMAWHIGILVKVLAHHKIYWYPDEDGDCVKPSKAW